MFDRLACRIAMAIIDTLRRQHIELTNAVRSVDARIATAPVDELLAELAGLRFLLSAHLAIEDRAFYPQLFQSAAQAGDHDAKATAHTFLSTMEFTATFAEGFFDKFSNRDELLKSRESLAKHWRLLVDALTRRINAEESALYPLFDRLSDNTASNKP